MSISIIIPALNEAAHLAATICSARSSTTCEVLVVDGGSSDATIAIAEAAGVQVIRTEPGRARQMNAGARMARGNIFLPFLHADTPPAARL
ncbi:MAG: glycosyltransferase [Blastocatellia bacterium]